MPTYNYKAVTENGNIVKNKVEDINRRSLIKKLKRNNLTPISIVQTGNKINSKTKKKKRNVSDVSEMIAGTNIQEYLRINEKKEPKSISKRLTTNVSSKVTTRDLVIFTQDLYLLKKGLRPYVATALSPSSDCRTNVMLFPYSSNTSCSAPPLSTFCSAAFARNTLSSSS